MKIRAVYEILKRNRKKERDRDRIKKVQREVMELKNVRGKRAEKVNRRA